MDFTAKWAISSDVEELVEVIVACRKELIEIVKRRKPSNRAVKMLYCDVHVSPKLTEFLKLSSSWKDHKETAKETDDRRSTRPYTQETIADCGFFNVVKDTIIGDEAIRVVAEFVTGDGTDEVMYGNVKILDVPENGHNASLRS